MAMKVVASAGMLIVTLGVAACGGGDPPSTELVRLHFEDDALVYSFTLGNWHVIEMRLTAPHFYDVTVFDCFEDKLAERVLEYVRRELEAMAAS